MASRLAGHAIELAPFDESEPVPAGCALLWDPALGMRPVPEVILASPLPVVASVLGLRSFALPIEEFARSPGQVERERALKAEIVAQWRRLAPRLAAAIVISRTCARDLERGLDVPRASIHVVHLAHDPDVFVPRPADRIGAGDFLLHVSIADAGRKNLPRVLEAYDRLPAATRPPFRIKLPAIPPGLTLPPGAEIVSGWLPPSALAALYRDAAAFVFPSLYEGFGLPIVEAMACGCPVITSRTSACPEVAGRAALLVDPRSADELSDAMARLCRDPSLRRRLARRGLRRARNFDWGASARVHARVLRACAMR